MFESRLYSVRDSQALQPNVLFSTCVKKIRFIIELIVCPVCIGDKTILQESLKWSNFEAFVNIDFGLSDSSALRCSDSIVTAICCFFNNVFCTQMVDNWRMQCYTFGYNGAYFYLVYSGHCQINCGVQYCYGPCFFCLGIFRPTRNERCST